MGAQTYLRVQNQPTKTTLSGIHTAFEFVVAYDDRAQSLCANADQLTSIQITTTAEFSISNAQPIVAVNTIPSGYHGQRITLINGGATFPFTIVTEALQANTNLILQYGYRTLGPGMALHLQFNSIAGGNSKWYEIGNVDDVPQTGIVAKPGGGQLNAISLDSKDCIVTTVATAADSVKLRTTTVTLGNPQRVMNLGANAMNLYPGSGAKLGNLALNAALSVPVGASVYTRYVTTNQYSYVLSA